VIRSIRITARAAAEIERADAWWRKNRTAALDAVRVDLKSAFALLALQPGVGERVENAKLAGTRSLQIDRLGYDVYYREQANVVVILALWHSHRARQPRV
jgi:plasmid stabilization system protein ParE